MGIFMLISNMLISNMLISNMLISFLGYQPLTLSGVTETLPGVNQMLPGVTQMLPRVAQMLPWVTRTLPGVAQTRGFVTIAYPLHENRSLADPRHTKMLLTASKFF
jgi:hypothetical protein